MRTSRTRASSGRTSSATRRRSSASRRSTSWRPSCSRPGRPSSTARVYCEPQLRQIIERVRPDVIVEDNVVAFPALLTSGAPFVRIVSCNPLEVKGPDVAPAYSGLPADDRGEWAAFRAEYDRTHRAMWEAFNAWVVEQGAPPLADLEFIHESDAANLYVFPEEADYTDRRPLSSTWHRMDSSVRETDDQYAGSGRGRRPSRGQRARLRLPGVARRCRRRPHATAGRRPRPHAAPLHREQGPAGGPDRARGQHGRRGVPARRPRSSRRSTSSSPTAGTTRPPRPCTSASR